jgi:hypothetical protein
MLRLENFANTSQGNVPRRNGGKGPEGQQFPVRIPADHPLGSTIFAWSWTNREQETFMNCAVVNITERLEYGPGQTVRMVGATRPVEKCRLSGSAGKIFEQPTSKPSWDKKPSTPSWDKKVSKPLHREEKGSTPSLEKEAPTRSGEKKSSAQGPENEYSAPSREEEPSTPRRDRESSSPGRDEKPSTPRQEKKPWTAGWGKKPSTPSRDKKPNWHKTPPSPSWDKKPNWYKTSPFPSGDKKPNWYKTSPSPSWDRKSSTPSWYKKSSTPSWYDTFSMPSWYRNNNQKKHQWHRRDAQEPVEPVQFEQRPKMFFTNVDNGCYSPKTHWELQYPDPGPVDDVVLGDCMYPMDLPCGTCGKPVDPDKCPVKMPGDDGDSDGEP